MSPQEKAEDLLKNMYDKQCALIAVKEIILALKQARQWTEYLSSAFADIDNDMNYWINVHKEIEKL